MGIKKALFHNIIAGSWGKISTVLFRLIQVPVMLYFLGIEEYGRWIVVYTLPSWIALANFGFGSVAGNEMSIAIGEGNIAKACKIFSSTLYIVTLIFISGLILILPLASFVNWEAALKLSNERHEEIKWVLIWFTFSTLLSFYGELFQGRFKAGRKAHVFIFLSSFRPWLELLLIIISLQFTKRFDFLAFSVFCATVIYVLLAKWLSYKAIPQIIFSYNSVQKKLLKPLFRKGLAFQAFPLGNAFIYQGNIIIVQLILGPIAVAIFSSVRTLVRSINQMLELINQVLWPELSLLFGSGELQKAARLHRIGVAASIGVAFFSVIVFAFWGETLFRWWTGGAFVLSKSLLLLFLLPIPFTSLWFTSSVIHMAFNKHEGLAVRYIIAMCLGTLACAILSYFFGIEGAAASTVIADIILIPYVFKVSLNLTNDTFENFIYGIKQDIQLLPKFFRK